MLTIPFCKVKTVNTPSKGHPSDAGVDFFMPEDQGEVAIQPGQHMLIGSGIKVFLPTTGVDALLAVDKSGIATTYKCIIGAKLIDKTYFGEIYLHIINVGDEPAVFMPNQKLIQVIPLPFGLNLEFKQLNPHEYNFAVAGFTSVNKAEHIRGDGAFGSTQTKTKDVMPIVGGSEVVVTRAVETAQRLENLIQMIHNVGPDSKMKYEDFLGKYGL